LILFSSFSSASFLSFSFSSFFFNISSSFFSSLSALALSLGLPLESQPPLCTEQYPFYKAFPTDLTAFIALPAKLPMKLKNPFFLKFLSSLVRCLNSSSDI
jgi:hypothetical protein